MRDYKFNAETLFQFSQSDPYLNTADYPELWKKLNECQDIFHFPAVHADVGSFLSLMSKLTKPRIIFEMGSGYGHSAFWYLLGAASCIEKIILTEKRDDLEDVFKTLPWPDSWFDKMDYYQGDAFDKLADCSLIDMALIDGVKGDYLKFLQCLHPKMNTGGVVFIDNSYWRGSFLDEKLAEKKASARNIKELHDYVKDTELWSACFLPFQDGVTVLTKN